MLRVLGAILILGSCVCQQTGHGPCTIVVNGNNHETVATVKPSCVNGSIWWEYPQGKMTAHFNYRDHSAAPYRVCVEDASGLVSRAEVLTMTDTSTGMPVILGTGTKETCTPPHQGEVILQFTGPAHSDHYIAFIDYLIKA